MIALHATTCAICHEYAAVDNNMCAPCGSASQELEQIDHEGVLSEWNRVVFFKEARRHHVGVMTHDGGAIGMLQA